MSKVTELAKQAGMGGMLADIVTNSEELHKFYELARADLEAEVQRLEAAQHRPAPCHKFCEANAFNVEIRGLEVDNAKLRESLSAIACGLEGAALPMHPEPHTYRWSRLEEEAIKQAMAAAAARAREKAIEQCLIKVTGLSVDTDRCNQLQLTTQAWGEALDAAANAIHELKGTP